MALVVMAEVKDSGATKINLRGMSTVGDLVFRGSVGETHVNFTVAGGGSDGIFDVPKTGEYADSIPLTDGRVLKVVTMGSFSEGQ